MTKPSASQLYHVYRSYPLYQNCQSFKVVKLIRSIHQPYLQEMRRGPMISKSPACLQNCRDLPSSESLTVDLDKTAVVLRSTEGRNVVALFLRFDEGADEFHFGHSRKRCTFCIRSSSIYVFVDRSLAVFSGTVPT